MPDSDVVAILRRIDDLQAKLSDLIGQIETSDRSNAQELADALYEECWFAASAEHVGYRFLDKRRWALRVLPGGSHGGIVSRRHARRHQLDITTEG